ncbi:MAG: LacI family DNA-binding transcriptional regulator [Kiritimatiellae bacterium]|nr:LacI family DNA-binding transcriptional regulator [Kiritimatiellia bacterium]
MKIQGSTRPAKRRTGRINLVEIAKLAGTSKSTVSRVVLNQPRVSPETRTRVLHILRAHNYQPNIFARGLTGARSGLIGVLGRWLESGFAAEVIRGINDEADRHGGRLLCSFAPGIGEYINLWKSFARGGSVDGVILIAPPMDIFKERVERRDRPVVLCASRPPHGQQGWQDVRSVTLENRRTMDTLIDHLLVQGHARLVHLAGPPDILDSREREKAFRKSVARHRRLVGTVLQGAWTERLAGKVVGDYLDSRHDAPDAFVAFNDAVALGAMTALRERGLSVPDDVAVTGWDDIPFTHFAGLTTVHLPMTDMGEAAARLLFSQFDGARGRAPLQNVVLDTPLCIRASSGRGAARRPAKG